MTNVDQLIAAKWIVTCNLQDAILEDHTIVVKDGNIIDLLPTHRVNSTYQSSNQQTFPQHAIFPGFINAHTHLAMNLFRGLADDLDLMDWLNYHIWPAEKAWVSEDMVYDGTKLAMAEMIRCGSTMCNDMFFFPEQTARVADECGLRAHIGMTVIDVPTAWSASSEECFQKGKVFFEQYRNHDRITPTFAPHSTYMVSMENLTRIKTLSDQYQVKTNIHLQEDNNEVQQVIAKTGKRPIELLQAVDLLSPNLLAIHMTQVTASDLDLLQRFKPQVVNCPESNMKLASGICPVTDMQALGVNIALGTDSAASNNDLNMINEMRSAAFVGKVSTRDPKATSAKDVLRMATINGAKALGVDHLCGSIEVGKSADFIACDFATIETQPLYNPISQLVYAGSREQVTDVWVAGRQLLKSRQLQTIDEKECISKAQEWRNKIKK